MNKLFTKIAGLSIGLAMAVGVGVAVGSKEVKVAMADSSPATFTVSSYASAHSWTGSGGGPYGQGSANALDIDSNVSVYCTGSTNSGKYYTDWRMYQSESATVVVSAKSSNVKLTAITFTYGNSNAGCLHTSKDTSVTAYYASGTKKTLDNVSSVTAYVANTGTKTNGQARITSIDVEYTVTASKTVSSISVTDNSGKSWYAGDTVAASDLTVRVNYSSGDPAIITNGTGVYFNSTHTQTTSAALAQGSNTVTVYYTDAYGSASNSVSISAAAAVSLSSIAITTAPTKTTYNEGEYFDTTGMVVTATYSDSNTANVTASCTFAPSTSTALTTSDKSVTVSYTYKGVEKTASQTIKVNPVESTSFIAGTDLGSTTGNNSPDSMTKSGFTVYGTDAAFAAVSSGTYTYRIYASSTVTFSVSSGSLGKITVVRNGSYAYSLLTLTSGGGTWNDSTGVWTGESSSVTFSASAQFRANSFTLEKVSTAPVVELDSSSATSVSMLKGDPDSSVKVHVLNIESKTWTFTFDENEEEGLSTSSYINVSAGPAVSNVHTLTITTKAVGSTTLHISVSGTACATSIPVTVAAKPASMTIVHSDIHEGELEVITGAYKQVSFSGEDTDGNAYSIAAGDVTPSATSGASHVTLSGSRITGASEGTAVVRYTLNALTSVYAEITVNVVDDYIESVGEPTFATGLTDTQGQSPTVSVFTSRPGTMRSGSSTTVPFENYKFSYTESYSAAEYGSVFSYDFSHGTTVDTTHKLQTIYVFCDIDDAAHGSYTVTVEQFNDPLQTITFTNVTNHAIDVTRGSTFQLEWAYDPENPTDGKEVEFVIDDNNDGIDITVSELGLISIGASSDLGTALVLIQSAHDDTIQDYVYVSAVLETMKYTVRETESLTPVSTVSAGDRVYMVATATDHSNATYEFSGYPGTYGGATVYTTTVAKLQLLVVEAGSSSGTVAFKLSGGDNDGEYISYSGSSNTLNHTSTKDASASWTVNGSTITNANTTARQIWMNWNNGTPRFACYTSKTSTTGYYCPTFIKVTGGDTEYDVTEALFNGVHNNFGGSGKTYKWDASCSSFDEDAWLNACVALTEITDYSSYKLNKAVADLSGNEVEVFLAKYDAIIRKFGTTHDHLDRFSVGGINYGGAININPLQSSVNNAGTSIAIIAISAVSLAAIGGYFLFRKKKEN